MQEINLLQNKIKDRTLQYERSNRIVLVIFTLIVLAELASVGGLLLLTKSTNSKSADVAAKSADIQNSMDSSQSDLTTAKGVQAQLKNVSAILTNRLYWTSFFDQISSFIPTNVQLNNISGENQDNQFQLQGTAPSYSDVGRIILAFSTSDKFHDVKLTTLAPSGGTTAGFDFGLSFTVDNSIFKK
ncbi:MAG TPA: PilN domain-containing protein [Patescibacteria group bacterium]|nr:PilN domain-containing protein [Patescibacteria group bacterium]